MGPKASLADPACRKWCKGSTKSFDLLSMGSIPFFLGIEGILTPVNHSIKVVLGLSGTIPNYSCGGSPASAMGRAVCHSTKASVMGRKFFHTRCIS